MARYMVGPSHDRDSTPNSVLPVKPDLDEGWTDLVLRNTCILRIGPDATTSAATRKSTSVDGIGCSGRNPFFPMLVVWGILDIHRR